MGLAGNLGTMALPDILQWVSQNKKTGTLTVESGVLQKRVLFRKGGIISSSSNDPREALGQFLLRARLASEQQIFDGLLQQEKERRLFGEILIDEGVLTEEQLHKALADKMRETVYDLFLWAQGEFAFEEQEELKAFFRVEMDLESMVLEGVRRVDEWARIRQVFPTENTTFAVKVRPPDASVSVAATLDLAEQGRTLREIALELRSSEFEAAEPLFKLYESGAIAVDSPGEHSRTSDTVARVQTELAQAEQNLRSRDGNIPLWRQSSSIDRSARSQWIGPITRGSRLRSARPGASCPRPGSCRDDR